MFIYMVFWLVFIMLNRNDFRNLGLIGFDFANIEYLPMLAFPWKNEMERWKRFCYVWWVLIFTPLHTKLKHWKLLLGVSHILRCRLTKGSKPIPLRTTPFVCPMVLDQLGWEGHSRICQKLQRFFFYPNFPLPIFSNQIGGIKNISLQ